MQNWVGPESSPLAHKSPEQLQKVSDDEVVDQENLVDAVEMDIDDVGKSVLSYINQDSPAQVRVAPPSPFTVQPAIPVPVIKERYLRGISAHAIGSFHRQSNNLMLEPR